MGNSHAPSGPLRLGVTGHRLLGDEERLRDGIREALCALDERFPGRALVVYSALAEGADRLVVEEALEQDAARFIAVLPLAVEEYVRDFSSTSSLEQFEQLLSRAAEVVSMPDSRSRDDAYWQAGRYVVEHADVLLALWDGEPAQGVSGTADVVAYARECARPLIWIRAGNRDPGTDLPTTLGSAQGRLALENFD